MSSSFPTTKITQDNLPADYEIPIIPASELSYSRALNDFILPNLPFIVTGLTNEWPARHAWVTARKDNSDAASKKVGGDSKPVTDSTVQQTAHTSEENGKLPNWDYLEKEYGEFQVTVHFSAKEAIQADSVESYGQGDTAEMKFKDVVKLWRNGQGSGLYVKDWHLKRELRDRQTSTEKKKQENKSSSLEDASTDSPINPSSSKMHNVSTQLASHHLNKAADASKDGESSQTSKEDEGKKASKAESFYTTPDIFKDDWMDNYYTNNTEDDFSFVYFGSKGTFTPLHRDVYTSYSWSANILGRKCWYFIPPSSIPYCRLYPSNPSSALHPDIRPGTINTEQYPCFTKAQVIQITQEEGSIVYVPSNWFHCVENLDDYVISINQNWGNGINLERMYESMLDAVQETEDALGEDDVKDVLRRRIKNGEELDLEDEWQEIVQNVLVQNVGWGWETFFAMIQYNLLHPPAPPELSSPPSYLCKALTKIFDLEGDNKHAYQGIVDPASHAHIIKKTHSKTRRAKSYAGAREVAIAFINKHRMTCRDNPAAS